MPRVLVPLASGFEEIEAVTLIDVLRRADIEVVVAGLTPGPVTGSHGIAISTDANLDKVLDEAFDLIALPGGLPGADHLENHSALRARLQTQIQDGGKVAAICAAPKVLATAGLLTDRRATSYPGFLPPGSTKEVEQAVVIDGNITTSRGPGTALAFALSLVEQLVGRRTRQALATRMLA